MPKFSLSLLFSSSDNYNDVMGLYHPTPNTVFIDTEFTPTSKQWLSLGAVCGNDSFYCETGDVALLRSAKKEFDEAHLQIKVLDQWGKAWLPGSVPSLAHCGFLFHQWMSHFTESRLFIAYDYSHDMQLLEDAIAACGLSWPKHWEPCYLGILNDDPAGDTAKEVMWHTMKRHFHLERHHALADAFALQAAYQAQIVAS